MGTDEFYSSAEAIMNGTATVDQIQTWLDCPLRASGGEIMDALAAQLLNIAKRAEEIELKAILLTDSIERGDLALSASTAVAAVALSKALKESKLRAER